MEKFELSLDYSEIDFLKTSLEVILNRQLNSIAKKKVWLKENEKKMKSLGEKVKAGKSGIFRNHKDKLQELSEKRKDVHAKLDKNKRIHKRAKSIYLKILNLIYKNDPDHIELIKENEIFLADDREQPYKDFYRKWDKTFF